MARLTTVNEAVMGQMLSDADSFAPETDERFAGYLSGIIAGVAIAQGRTTEEVLESFLTYTRKRGVYEDVVRELEMLYDEIAE